MEFVPSKLLQQAREIVDTMDRTSKEIFEEKKKALRKGEDAVVKQVGMGKDIMSVLCELCCLGLAYRLVCADVAGLSSKSEHGGRREREAA